MRLTWRRNVSPVRYELVYCIRLVCILHSHRRENLKSYTSNLQSLCRMTLTIVFSSPKMFTWRGGNTHSWRLHEAMGWHEAIYHWKLHCLKFDQTPGVNEGVSFALLHTPLQKVGAGHYTPSNWFPFNKGSRREAKHWKHFWISLINNGMTWKLILSLLLFNYLNFFSSPVSLLSNHNWTSRR
jgi:hypothetical protein